MERSTGNFKMLKMVGYMIVLRHNIILLIKVPPHQKGKKTKWYGWKGRPQQVSLNLLIKILGDRLIGDEKFNK